MKNFIPLDRPVTQITRPAKGPLDRTATGSERAEDEAGDIGSNGCRPLKEDNGEERPRNSLEHPLLFTTSTLPSPPITATSSLFANHNFNKPKSNQTQ